MLLSGVLIHTGTGMVYTKFVYTVPITARKGYFLLPRKAGNGCILGRNLVHKTTGTVYTKCVYTVSITTRTRHFPETSKNIIKAMLFE